MDNVLSILIVESEPAECNAYSEYVDSIEDVSIAGITGDADEALEIFMELSPGVVVMELELLKGSGNGITLLSEMRKEGSSAFPYVLVTTNNGSSIIHTQLRELGADFIMMKSQKNYSAKYVIDFIRLQKSCILHTSTKQTEDITETETVQADKCESVLFDRISADFDMIGICPKLIGRTYLLEAILLVAEGTRVFVPIIAKKHCKTDASVERAMQNAINNLWRTGDAITLQTLYTAHINPQKGMPTLNEFVYFYANKHMPHLIPH